MTAQEVKDYLVDNGCEGAIVYDDYPEAFIGHTPDGRAVYDYDKIVETLMNDGGNGRGRTGLDRLQHHRRISGRHDARDCLSGDTVR